MQGHTGLEAGTEKPPGTPAAVCCLSWFCVASRLFLVLLFLCFVFVFVFLQTGYLASPCSQQQMAWLPG